MNQTRRIAALILLLSTLSSCASGRMDSEAQTLIDSMAATHPDVTRLTLHAMPSGASKFYAIASTSTKKRGGPSDPEDMQAMESGEVVTLLEESGVDVTVPIQMRDGKHREAVGVTMSISVNRAAAIEQAKKIAAAIDKARSARRAASRPSK